MRYYAKPQYAGSSHVILHDESVNVGTTVYMVTAANLKLAHA